MSVEFEFSSERRALRDLARTVCADVWPEAEVRRLMETREGFDRDGWRRLGREAGLAGLTVPAEYGGAGAGLVDLAVVAEEFGAAPACSPLLGTVALSATALQRSGDAEVAKQLLPAVTEGERVLALAATDDRGTWQPSRPTTTARRVDGGGRIDGAQAHVIDGDAADALLVLADVDGPAGMAGQADVDGRSGLFLVEGDAPGLGRELMSTLDLTRRQARLRFDGVAARLVGDVDAGARAVADARDTATVVLAAAAVGGAQRMLDLSVDYARTRLQFGRPIGSFQAVKHRCADMLVATEQARSTAYHAAWACDEAGDDHRLAASLAQVTCADAYKRVASDAIQVHGGIGFTWEHPAHLYYKRAVSDAALLGRRAFHTGRLADLVLDDAVA